MIFEFIYDKLGLVIIILGLILTVLLVSNAYMKKLFYVVDDARINSIKIKKPSRVYLFLKRLFDFTFASLSLLLLSPTFIIIFVLVRIFIRGSVIKTIKITDKLTKHNYSLYVFRTVEDNQIKMGKLGSFLRIYSLNELPKLINIIKGDISFVGRYSYKHFDEFLNTLPSTQIELIKEYPIGLVNLWAVTLHSTNIRFDYSEIYKYDLIYSSKASFLFDIYIIVKTTFLFLGNKATK